MANVHERAELLRKRFNYLDVELYISSVRNGPYLIRK